MKGSVNHQRGHGPQIETRRCGKTKKEWASWGPNGQPQSSSGQMSPLLVLLAFLPTEAPLNRLNCHSHRSLRPSPSTSD